ncbi:MAG TPA: sulfotransferase [candidate division Zixibacteria bacterium]|nr:sulfotransferase [candidate division Zixibacteria bacterium]
MATERSPAGGELVFVVGVSRSGTTLVRNILNRHSLIAIGPENHYLGHLVGFEGVRHRLRRFGDLRDDANLRQAVAYLFHGMHTGRHWREPSRLWQWLRRNVDEVDFLNRLHAGDRSERAIFAEVLRAYGERKGKPIIGEKTPAHLRYVDTLLEWFPDARVIHMMRDPRGIFVSDARRRRLEPGSVPFRVLRRVPPLLDLVVLLQTTLAWGESVARARAYLRRHRGRYRVIRFEDLVRDPERVVIELSEFVRVPFEPAMLEQSVVSAGTRLGERGFDPGAADRWRAVIPGWAAAWLRLVFGRQLRRLGYEPATPRVAGR